MAEIIDLRELAEELADLEFEEEDLEPGEALDEDDRDRLEALRTLQRDQFYGDMADYARNESTLIPEDGFEDYMQQMAEDLGYTADSDDNPLHQYIDWGAWADACRVDYMEVEFDDDTYLIRSY